MEDIYFQGKMLPPLRLGLVYAMQIWPGGRLVVKQYKPERLRSIDDAVEDLLEGKETRCKLDEAESVILKVTEIVNRQKREGSMEWTRSKPDTEGWYWAQNSIHNDTHMVFVQQVADYWHVWNPLERKESGVDAFEWWYGPLTYPYRTQIKRNPFGS